MAEAAVDPDGLAPRAGGAGGARAASSRPAVPDGDTLGAAPRRARRLRRGGPRRSTGAALAARLAAMPTIPPQHRAQGALAVAGGARARRARSRRGRSEAAARLEGGAAAPPCTAAGHGRRSAVVARYEADKRERGVLDFVDLLVKARDALRDRETVRAYFRGRFPVLIIDEFQDGSLPRLGLNPPAEPIRVANRLDDNLE